LWVRGQLAFDVRPYPFFRRSVQVAESPMLELIRARVAEEEI
jgi:hypothetical protein